jgi:hypothetical protein
MGDWKPNRTMCRQDQPNASSEIETDNIPRPFPICNVHVNRQVKPYLSAVNTRICNIRETMSKGKAGQGAENYNGKALNAEGPNALSLNRVCDIINNVLNRDEGAVAPILA